ncbi:hypothetical protein P0136_03095 [Lentisphaerota bacterium ZTH]|nr:hypothetical protein JYG24_05770 [Lentisphaerota bacterium]WET06988.1 hypothetical protein P0136_03095 [Lentisphaerota bacterium ZTH]
MIFSQLSPIEKKQFIKAVLQEGLITDYCLKCNITEKQCCCSYSVLNGNDSKLKLCDGITKKLNELATNKRHKLKDIMLQRRMERCNKAIDFEKQPFGVEQKTYLHKK